ncbi:hypothetical protein EDC04DRAFT_2610988 [Pisolithus marmoratus]|nr:hypothetical protein EDC04DRAFT_2610988 [Pisolithus marmoratus]
MHLKFFNSFFIPFLCPQVFVQNPEGYNNASPRQVPDSGHGPLERCLKDICQKISEVNEMQTQLEGDKQRSKAWNIRMKSVGKTLRDHEGQLSVLDNTQRRVAEEFNNLEMQLTSLQKNHIRKDASLKDIQASLTNLETNLALYRHDLRQQLKDKNNGLHQCISHLSSQLDERLTILEKKADGIWSTQDKHTALFSQALAGIHSLSQGREHSTGSEETGPEDPLHYTTGASGEVPCNDDGRNLAVQLYHYSMGVICSTIQVLSIQSGISLTTFEWIFCTSSVQALGN